MKKAGAGVVILIIILVLAIVGIGAYFLFKNHDVYSCGASDLTSKLPTKNIGDLQMIKVIDDGCSIGETKVKGILPKMIEYGGTNYQTPEGGTYSVTIVEFANENDAIDATNYFKEDAQRNFQPILQAFGQNKVVWSMRDTNVIGAMWKSTKYVVIIDNRGNQNINSDLVINLLANFPSDNDIVLNSSS